MVVGDARRAGVGRSRARDDCTDAVVNGGRCGDAVEALPAQSSRATPASRSINSTSEAATLSTEEALAQLERSASALAELQPSHRRATLGAVANRTLTADTAIVRVDTLRSLEALSHHAWRSVAHLVSAGK
jgi:phosphate:Na+ symporter